MYEDSHLEMAYEDRFHVEDDGYDDMDYLYYEGDDDEDEEPVCDLHGPGHATASFACELKSQENYYGTD